MHEFHLNCLYLQILTNEILYHLPLLLQHYNLLGLFPQSDGLVMRRGGQEVPCRADGHTPYLSMVTLKIDSLKVSSWTNDSIILRNISIYFILCACVANLNNKT